MESNHSLKAGLLRPVGDRRVDCSFLHRTPWVSRVIRAEGRRIRPRTKFIIEGEKPVELAVPGCLDSLGISLLCELDVLDFVYRHGVSLTSADQIARLIGYETSVVSGVLGRLEGKKLIERSPASQGVAFYQILASTSAARQGCIQQLVNLSRTRAGRVLLTKQLKPLGRNQGDKRLRLEKEGKWLCLKMI
jgi:DNA-binding MarR family transcriptional regulator